MQCARIGVSELEGDVLEHEMSRVLFVLEGERWRCVAPAVPAKLIGGTLLDWDSWRDRRRSECAAIRSECAAVAAWGEHTQIE